MRREWGMPLAGWLRESCWHWHELVGKFKEGQGLRLEPVYKSRTMGFLTRRDQQNLSGIDGSGDPSYIKRRLDFDLKTGA